MAASGDNKTCALLTYELNRADDDVPSDDSGDYLMTVEVSDDSSSEQGGVQRIKFDDDDEEADPRSQRIKSAYSRFEIAPREPAPLTVVAAASSVAAPPLLPAGDTFLPDHWTDHETSVLIDAWGEKTLQLGRRLWLSEWRQVAEKVFQETNIPRTDNQCRNRIDSLKRKYKREKKRLAEEVDAVYSDWKFFFKMDSLLCAPLMPPVFNNPPEVRPNHPSGFDEQTRDIPESSMRIPPKKTKKTSRPGHGGDLSLLTASLEKFTNAYEETERRWLETIEELHRMRMDFQRDLDLELRQIIERALNGEGEDDDADDDDDDMSAEI